MTNEQNNNQEQVNQDNQDARDNRFDHVDQKPDKPSGREWIIGICVLVAVFALAFAFNYLINGENDTTDTTETDNAKVSSNLDQQLIELLPASGLITNRDEYDCPPDEDDLPETKYEDSYPSDEDRWIGDVTKESEKSMNLTLYQVPVSGDNILIEPNSDGSYALESDAIYAICWNAIPLFRTEDGKVNATVTASATYLITEDEPGTITITIKDINHSVSYNGTLDIATVADNLGIEFCSDECGDRRTYGSYPEIRDGEFTLCFYTSGSYVKPENHNISGAEGKYNYMCGADGYESEERFVTRPED